MASAPAEPAQATVLDPTTGLPPGWRQREKTILTGVKAGETQPFFENLQGKRADSIRKLMKFVCDVTGEDVEQLVQQSMAIRSPPKSDKSKAAPKGKAKAEAAPKAKAKAKAKEPQAKEQAKEAKEVKAAKESAFSSKQYDLERHQPHATSSFTKRKSAGGKLDRLDPETLLPPGWVHVEKKYKTGGSVGKTYVRFQKEDGTCSNLLSIPAVLKKHLEDTGVDLTSEYHEKKLQKESARKEERAKQSEATREERTARQEEQKAKREQYIENFRSAYGGALSGAVVSNFDGWSGEAKHLTNCNQYAASYYDPQGRCWKLIKDIEAHFGKLMEEGREDEIPDIAAAREKDSGVNTARQNRVEEWTMSQQNRDLTKEDEGGPKRRKANYLEETIVDYAFYRETNHMKLLQVSKMTEKAIEQEKLLDAPSLQKEARLISQLLVKRGFPESTQVLYLRGAEKKVTGTKMIRTLRGWYFQRSFEVDDRPCYQHLKLIDGRLACGDCHMFWSAKASVWKLGRLNDEKAGVAICDDRNKEVLKATKPWKLYEPPQEGRK